MAETNGHAPPIGVPATASADALDALLLGLFEPTTYELEPGRVVEIRPLKLGEADRLYAGLTGAPLQRFLLARCVYIEGLALGDELAERLPVALANRLVPVVMSVNGMQTPATADGEGGEAPDPKA